jgi:hypothetical protein
MKPSGESQSASRFAAMPHNPNVTFKAYECICSN